MVKRVLAAFCVAALCCLNAFSQDTFAFRVGECEVVLLSERQGALGTEKLIGATDAMLEQTVPDGIIPNAVNAFLIKAPGKNILVDAGLGIRLVENLKDSGVDEQSVDHILLTHMHGDHIGGLMKEDKAVFPNAKLTIADREAAYWTDDVCMNRLPENSRGGFHTARKAIATYAERLELVEPSSGSLVEGVSIKPVEAYGHTPGHIAYLLESAGEKLLIWGDLAHGMAVQMPFPRVAVTYDADPETATASRLKLLQLAATENIPVAGMHIAYPGIGRIESTGENTYRFVPAE